MQGFFYWSGVIVWSLIAVGIVLASWFTIAATRPTGYFGRVGVET